MGIGIFIVVDPDEPTQKKPKFKIEKERESSIEILEEYTYSLSNKEIERSPPIRIPVVNSLLPNPYSSNGQIFSNQFFNG